MLGSMQDGAIGLRPSQMNVCDSIPESWLTVSPAFEFKSRSIIGSDADLHPRVIAATFHVPRAVDAGESLGRRDRWP